MKAALQRVLLIVWAVTHQRPLAATGDRCDYFEARLQGFNKANVFQSA